MLFIQLIIHMCQIPKKMWLAFYLKNRKTYSKRSISLFSRNHTFFWKKFQNCSIWTFQFQVQIKQICCWFCFLAEKCKKLTHKTNVDIFSKTKVFWKKWFYQKCRFYRGLSWAWRSIHAFPFKNEKNWLKE